MPARQKKFFSKIKLQFDRIRYWEYWSFNVIYTPIYFYWFYLCLRARNFFFFNASNPTILNGGFLLERKSDIYNLMPEVYFPKTLLIEKFNSVSAIAALIENADLGLPVIVKPDIGGRGRGVKRCATIGEAANYVAQCSFPMLVQSYCNYPIEAGIFYYRYPWEKSGKISGIVLKEMLTVTGDGYSTVEELLEKDTRHFMQLSAIRKMHEVNLQEVLPDGVSKTIVPFGNHARGAKFIDVSHYANEALSTAIHEICNRVPGFYFGRIDIRFSSWQALQQQREFSIIELNGAGSEPTHIYDRRHSLFFGWQEITRHWKILWRISKWNKQRGIGHYLSFKNGISMFRENSRVEKILEQM